MTGSTRAGPRSPAPEEPYVAPGPAPDAQARALGARVAAFAASEARFRAVQDASPDGFVLCRAVRDAAGAVVDLEYVYANPATARVVGRPPEALVGRRALALFPALRESGLLAAYAAVAAGAPPYRTELRYRADGLDAVFAVSAVHVGPGEVGITFADVTDAHEAAARAVRLQTLTAALAGARTVDDVAAVVVAQAVATTGAKTGMLAARVPGAGGAGPGEAEIIQQTGFTAEVLARYVRFPLTAPGPAARCLRTGAPAWVTGLGADTLGARFPDAHTVWESFGVAAAATVPLAVAGPAGAPETVGVMSFTWAEPRALPPEDREFFLALGRQAAQALERARLLAAERGARAEAERAVEQARRLQALTARLNQATSREQIADVIFAEGLAAVGADAGSLALAHPGPDGGVAEFEVVRTAGFAAPLVARYRRFAPTPGAPLTEAVRRRELATVSSPEEWRARYPAAPEQLTALGAEAFAAVPVCAGERALAALLFTFRDRREFDPATRAFLATLGEQCALALERQRLHEEALGHAEQHAALLRTIQDAFVAYDRGLRFTYVNPRAEALLRRPAAALLGRRLDEVVPETRGTPVYEAIRRTLATGEGAAVEAWSVATGCWLDARVYPAPDGVAVVFQDVTARRRAQDGANFMAEASRVLAGSLDYAATLRAVAEAAVPRLGDWCAVDVVEDPAARRWPPVVERLAVVHRDPAMRALGAELTRRYPTDWAAAGGMAAVLREGTPFFVPEVTEAMLVGGARDAGHLALLRALRFASVLVVPLVARGLTLGALTLCTTESGRRYDEADRALALDVAERAALAVDNARLYREAERARAQAEQARAEAEAARSVAEAASRAKGEFLANMSHELRTPLNAIGGYAELLELGIRGPVTPEQRADLGRLRRAQQHLLGLITDVLDYAKLEGGRVEYDVRAVDVREVVAAVAPLVEPLFRVKGLAYAVQLPDAPCLVWADPERLAQVLVNLLSNAAKFTDPPGAGADAGTQDARSAAVTVDLAARAAGPDAAGPDAAGPDAAGPDVGRPDLVFLRVRDTGRGIARAQQERVFEPFVQVGKRFPGDAPGTGLGLAISRDLARGMGGDLRVRSVPGEGATFTVALRRADPGANGPPAPAGTVPT